MIFVISIGKYPEFVEEKRNEKLFQILNSKSALNPTGRVFYVSNDGNDDNDGLSPDTPWKTFKNVNKAINPHYPYNELENVDEDCLKDGDTVLFRRGDLFRGGVLASSGVSYGAYGEGEKPRFYGGEMDYADEKLWSEFDTEKHIWKLEVKLNDPGTTVFNHGEKHSRKLIPSYRNGRFVCRYDESKPFDVRNEMTQNLDIFWEFDEVTHTTPSKGEDFPVPMTGPEYKGVLYLRCDEGNPGEVFDSIESVSRETGVRVAQKKNVTIDNICMKYMCFGVAASRFSSGLTVTNCEIGWIGGNIQHYNGTDPNYPQGKRGSVTRFGNCIEIYGGCENYTVKNCYLYQCYDAGATHQFTTAEKIEMKHIRYSGNLIENCVYGIEYFLNQINGERESCMEDVVMDGNIIRLSGYGWGQQRHNVDTPALIKGWSYVNTAKNYRIYDNIFDRSAYRMVHLVALKDEFCPEMWNNTYVQNKGGMLGQYGGNEKQEPKNHIFDENVKATLEEVFKEKNPTVYVVEEN